MGSYSCAPNQREIILSYGMSFSSSLLLSQSLWRYDPLKLFKIFLFPHIVQYIYTIPLQKILLAPLLFFQLFFFEKKILLAPPIFFPTFFFF